MVMKTVFSAKKMISIFGFKINDNIDVEFCRDDAEVFQDNDWHEVSSSLSIMEKTKASYGIAINNFEEKNKIYSIMEFESILSPDGNVTALVPMNNPEIKTAMYLINQYIKIFMAIYTVDTFCKEDTIMLRLKVDYTNDSGLKITKVTSAYTELFKHYSWYSEFIEIEIEPYINQLLNKVGIECLTNDIDIDHTIELLKMQDLITEMDMI